MAVIGVDLDSDELVLTKGRDFKWAFVNLDAQGSPLNFPGGSLYIEFAKTPIVTWPFVISGPNATIKVESEMVALIPHRTKWQLVFRSTGESAGGDPIARGVVRVQE